MIFDPRELALLGNRRNRCFLRLSFDLSRVVQSVENCPARQKLSNCKGYKRVYFT